jgi:glycerol-1-phosphate dehydrogenase [NAD(P)+]
MILDSREWDARYGSNVLAEHAQELDGCIAITSPSAWAVAEPRLVHAPRHREFHGGMGEDYLDDLLERLPEAERVVAIGGGNALDVGKYVAWKKDLPLVMIPTIVSTGAVFQSPVAVRRADRWEFCWETVAPDYLLFDYGVIRSAPPHLNRAGMGECVCQLGGNGAWRWWDEQGFGGLPFDPELAAGTAAWVRERCAEFSADLDADGQPGATGIRIAAEVNRERYDLPTWDIERRGVDHAFVIAFEWVNRRELIHAEGVSLGSLIGAYLYEADFAETKRLLDSCGVRYRPAEIGCTRAEVRATLERISEPVGPDGPENWFHRRTLDDETFDAMMTAIESGE